MLQTISIHALREEGDPKPDHEWPGIHVISIHALREEGDPGHSAALPTAPRFLSTPSARRATLMALPSLSRMAYFYPRPPRGGRREEELAAHHQKLFLSTPSARRATERLRVPRLSSPNFYPRPPRGGRLALARLFVHGMDFYPRPPRGGRQRHWPTTGK